MVKGLVIILMGLFMQPAFAQKLPLKAAGTAPDLYITHTVAAKENYYSLGRLYNVAPKELAPYNNLQFEKGLSLGQVIKVPLTTANFTQTGELKTEEAAVPVYHTVQPKEGLYRISVNYNKVSLEALRIWNKLTSDVVSNGTNIVIGYLKVLTDQSTLAKKSTKIEKAITENPIVKNPEVQTPVTPVEEKKVAVNPIAAQEKPVKTNDPDIDKQVRYTDNPAGKPTIDYKGGAFKKSFRDSDASTRESGTTGVFKSTSGWQDGKFYCLHNSARPETIIKVTNPANGRVIYAKVLDMMPDLKQNSGSLILISNAAAEELGISEAKADITLNYSQK